MAGRRHCTDLVLALLGHRVEKGVLGGLREYIQWMFGGLGKGVGEMQLCICEGKREPHKKVLQELSCKGLKGCLSSLRGFYRPVSP